MLRLLVALLVIPLGLDLYLPVPEDNPITKEKIALERKLFFDRQLSRDGWIACGSEHVRLRARSRFPSAGRSVLRRPVCITMAA